MIRRFLLPLLATAFFQSILALFPDQSAGMDTLSLFATALAIGWSSVWLLGPRLCVGGRAGAFFLGLAVMFAVGAIVKACV